MPQCPVYPNLEPDSLSALSIGQRSILFVAIADLLKFVLLDSGLSCDECELIWRVSSHYKTDWDVRDSSQSAELRIGIRAPLQLFWRRDCIYLEIFRTQKRSCVFGFFISWKGLVKSKYTFVQSLPDLGGDDVALETTILATIDFATEISQKSSSEACFQLASSWLQDCVASHKACSLSPAPQMPTRVIDVGMEGSQNPFLCESNGKTGQHVALSYCQGDPITNNLLKTTTQILEKHMRCIKYEYLPQTLQDAVTITRRSGLECLWVDALCII